MALLTALPPTKTNGGKISNIKDLKNSPIKFFDKEREPKVEKIHVNVSHTENSIVIKLHDMSISLRTNSGKFDRYTHNISNASELKFASEIQSYIKAKIKNMPNMNDFIADIQALNITQTELNKDSIISTDAIKTWINEKYPYIEFTSESITISDLFGMCEGYVKISHDIQTLCGTATSIRIILNRLVPPEKKEKK